ncbi:MAG: ATP-binding protein [Oscillospiraceae bacterium]|nr:ATP-binding protein [Oscillospiraceae bacterium]
MVRLIMGEKGTGKTKMLIELINSAAEKETGNVVCIEAKSTMTFDVNHQVRLLSASEYQIADYATMKGFVSGLYAGNYDISHIFIDNLLKIVDGHVDHEADSFLAWLERFSNKYGVKFTVSVSVDPSLATEEMRTYM